MEKWKSELIKLFYDGWSLSKGKDYYDIEEFISNLLKQKDDRIKELEQKLSEERKRVCDEIDRLTCGGINVPSTRCFNCKQVIEQVRKEK